MKIIELEKKIRSCAFNHDQTALACGLSDGTLVVLNSEYIIKSSLGRKYSFLSLNLNKSIFKELKI
jgi:hypothetical protein